MGILNVTPDSFYDGGQYEAIDTVVKRAEEMLVAGADILDIGGYSSKPNATEVSLKEELNRVLPAIRAIVKAFPEAILSIDTFRSEVAKQSIEAGAAIINDISAGNLDPAMFDLVEKLNVPYIMMHMQGTPQTMQKSPAYEHVTKDIIRELSEKVYQLKTRGANDILIDPGFGFGKTIEQNYKLLRELELFSVFELPLLVGVSRKSMIYKVLDTQASEALNGTTALHMFALERGANILRVHDVKEAKEVIMLHDQLTLA